LSAVVALTKVMNLIASIKQKIPGRSRTQAVAPPEADTAARTSWRAPVERTAAIGGEQFGLSSEKVTALFEL
jgi:hypothetical protein